MLLNMIQAHAMRRKLLKANRRHGVTLTEVLIALFIMALGILALLSLFPLAALQMAQAVKDDRTGTLATNADVMCRTIWRKAWQGYSPPNLTFLPVPSEPGIVALDGPVPTTVATSSSGPSNAVLIDPIGVYAAAPHTLAGAGTVPRYTWQFITNNPPSAALCVRMCSVLDDMTFSQTTGEADTSNGVIDRGGRYSVSWLLQRPVNSNRDSVGLTVLVYQNRPVTSPSSGEYAVSGTLQTTTSIILSLPGINPNLRKGGWIMDVTTPSQPAFYRIVSYVYNSSAQTGTVELQLPLQSIVTGTGSFYILDDLVEVFSRPVILGPSSAGTPGYLMQQ